MLTEFGGVSFTRMARSGSWGYQSVDSADDYRLVLTELFDAVRASTALSGFCYTQLADTGLETNGLLDLNRQPKLAIEEIRRIVDGSVR